MRAILIGLLFSVTAFGSFFDHFTGTTLNARWATTVAANGRVCVNGTAIAGTGTACTAAVTGETFYSTNAAANGDVAFIYYNIDETKSQNIRVKMSRNTGDAEWGGKRQSVTFSQKYKTGQIIVSFGDRRLYLVTKPGSAISYPIAVPREQSRWQGVLTVSDKRENPAWTPTPEMMRENPRLPNWVPGGHPMNPLGVRALYLGSSAYRIHGTDAPWTIGQAVSHGCIRMTNEDVLDLYPRIPVGTRVTVTWQKFSAAAVA